MSLFEFKAEIPPECVSEMEELIALLEEERLMVLEDKPSARAWLAGYFETAAAGHAVWQRLTGLTTTVPLPSEPAWRELADQDWRDSYKAHFHAWQFGRLHWVPVWERASYPIPPDAAVIWLDPGLAFGTGNHETTRLCCERLVAYALAQSPADLRTKQVLDAGCGSGILALSAARLGFVRVEGFDNDPEAVRVSLENAALNGLDGRVLFFTGDLVEGLAARQVDLLMANIQADVLMQFADRLVGAVAPGGQLVLSGILATEIEQVAAAFVRAAPGWTLASRTLEAWSDLCLTRPQ